MDVTISRAREHEMTAHCTQGFPLEACGLLLGPLQDGHPSGTITEIWPSKNVEESARVYSVDPKDLFEATRYANQQGLDIVGVYHSHTHTQAYPSPTDIAQAVDAQWCYVIVSLAEEEIDVRYFFIREGNVVETIPIYT